MNIEKKTTTGDPFAACKLTFAQNLRLTIQLLVGFGLVGAALWGLSLWTTAK